MSNNQRIIYRIAGFLLSFIGYMALISSFGMIFGAEVSGLTLGLLFVSACIVIYSTLSRFFFHSAIVNNRPMKYSIKDWIKINAYITIVVLIIAVLGGVALLTIPSILDQVMATMQTAATQAGGAAGNVSQSRNFYRTFEVFNIIISVSGLVHCIWTLRLVKKYKAYFQ